MCKCVFILQCMCVRAEGSVSVLCIFIMRPVAEYLRAHVMRMNAHTLQVVC